MAGMGCDDDTRSSRVCSAPVLNCTKLYCDAALFGAALSHDVLSYVALPGAVLSCVTLPCAALSRAIL